MLEAPEGGPLVALECSFLAQTAAAITGGALLS
jgi:hypothetical protein